ncbi:MAG TPA: divergent polysaccharide deacetylase family protein [Thermoanaerobaculia bacterium]
MPRRPRRLSPATLFFAALSLVLAGVVVWLWRTRVSAPSPPAPTAATPTAPRGKATLRPARPTALARRSPAAAPSGTPRIAILIDDLGNDRAAAARIAAWPWPVAGAVLPNLPGSAPTARALEDSGKEVLLHLPMEPQGYPGVRPGPGVVLRAQSDGEIAATLERDLATVPGASGINNHMGSAATADPRVMRAVATVLSRRGLFFVDSRTTTSTVARDEAEKARVPSTSRRVFLDDTATTEAVSRAFDELVRRAKEEGEALAIGHPHPATLDVLERELRNLPAKGVRLVRVRDLVR